MFFSLFLFSFVFPNTILHIQQESIYQLKREKVDWLFWLNIARNRIEAVGCNQCLSSMVIWAHSNQIKSINLFHFFYIYRIKIGRKQFSSALYRMLFSRTSDARFLSIPLVVYWTTWKFPDDFDLRRSMCRMLCVECCMRSLTFFFCLYIFHFSIGFFLNVVTRKQLIGSSDHDPNFIFLSLFVFVSVAFVMWTTKCHQLH